MYLLPHMAEVNGFELLNDGDRYITDVEIREALSYYTALEGAIQ